MPTTTEPRPDALQRLTAAPRAFSLRARVRAAVAALLVLLAVLVLREWPQPADGAELRGALAAHLTQTEGLQLTADPVVWLAAARGPFGVRPALFVAQLPHELPDVYYADVRASGDGSVLDVFWLQNLTRSSSAAEGSLTRVGERVAFTIRVGARYDAVTLLDPRGEPDQLTADWPAYAKLQNAITNLQDTGRSRGFGRYRYSLVPPADSLALDVEHGQLIARADGERIAIDPESHQVTQGVARVRRQDPVKGRPGTLTWAVDTVRKVSFIGPGPIEWLEHTVFGLTDRAERAYHGVVRADTEAEVRAALPMAEISEERRALLTATGPELGWPPDPLTPVLEDEVRGEGEWLPVVDDPFVNSYPNAPAAFYQTFIRVDPERPYTRVYVTLWDPRQVQLHIAMGTREPESATGETGSGMIEREPELLERLVGAFNGGFQAMHGEFGMMSEGRVYLPPKPWAATLAVYEDGRVGMGSWPGPGRGGWDEEAANQQIPPDMVAMRQNLTSVVEDGQYNPWKRWWWGAAPVFADEQTYIHRSGACLTKAGHMAYLWGESMGPQELGDAMLALDCERGLHLDMNSKHTGLEFYRPLPAGAPALERELGDAEFEGNLEGAEGLRVRSRLAVTTMTPLRFPRYLGRDPRDFFYLSLKPVLPGPDLSVGTQSIAFETHGLPHAGWPHAFARAQIADSAGRGSWLLRIDTSRALPAAFAPPELDRPLAFVSPLGEGGHGDGGAANGRLCLVREPGPSLLLRPRLGPPGDGGPAALCGPVLGEQGARAALGVDQDGFVVYAERDGVEAGALVRHLQRAGVERAIAVERLVFVVDDQPVSLDGHRARPVDRTRAVALLAETRPAAQVMFPEVEPKPYRHWGWLQGQRVRYFPKGEPRFRAPEDAQPSDP